MPAVHVIEHPHAGFARMLAVKPAGVLLQGAFPRDRHSQYQRIQRRVVETFPDQPASREHDTGRVTGQRIKGYQLGGARLSAEPSVQHEQRLHRVFQHLLQAIEMVRPLGEYQHVTPLFVLFTDGRRDHLRARCVLGEMCKHRLDRRVVCDVHRSIESLREDLKQLRRVSWQPRRMPDRPAQHEHHWLLAVAPHRRRGQAQHVARLNGLEYRLEGIRGDMVTFIDDDLSVTPQQLAASTIGCH
ncbi:hypothetical protein BamMEX5DRAFT_6633 [Burkholderia ambifaria MEX-5]|uniref:Uncharacterized protein n=1 Tax=Burkholderia ambifaria MEX-5 TaxID=396597 RepID=B1TFR7_9BURK|nr:hypothetical protein BamMEX5DRAFT_6633 [Burkholderia ambifaria MEX-5]